MSVASFDSLSTISSITKYSQELTSQTNEPAINSDGIVFFILIDLEMLWYIYSYYCICADPYNIYNFSLHSFVAFLKDVQMYPKVVNSAKASVLFNSEISIVNGKKQKYLTYSEFINLLVRLADYNSQYIISLQVSCDKQFSIFLETYIYPYSNKWDYIKWYTEQIIFDNAVIQNYLINYKQVLQSIIRIYINKEIPPNQSIQISYSSLYKFLKDFGLVSSVNIRIEDVAEIFTCCLMKVGSKSSPLKYTINFNQFLQFLFHLSLRLCLDEDISILNCLKGLFQTVNIAIDKNYDVIMLHLNRMEKYQMSQLLKSFQQTYTLLWNKDKNINYYSNNNEIRENEISSLLKDRNRRINGIIILFFFFFLFYFILYSEIYSL